MPIYRVGFFPDSDDEDTPHVAQFNADTVVADEGVLIFLDVDGDANTVVGLCAAGWRTCTKVLDTLPSGEVAARFDEMAGQYEAQKLAEGGDVQVTHLVEQPEEGEQ